MSQFLISNRHSATDNYQLPITLTLDIGTSSVRGTLWNARAVPLPEGAASIKHQPRATADGGVEFDAEELLARCEQILDALHAKAVELGIPIHIVALDTIVSNMLGVDGAGRALTPIFTYADSRSASALAALREKLDVEATYQRVGFPLHTSFWPAQMACLRMTQPDTYRRVKRWLTYGDYFMWRWCGRHAVSYSCAAWTGLLNRFTWQWDEPQLNLLQLDPQQLSLLVTGAFCLEGLRAEYASRWPLLQRARWMPAIADGAAANLGSGCFDASRMAVTIGTTCGMRVVMQGTPQQLPPGLWNYPLDDTRSLIGGSLNEGGIVLAWLRGLLGNTLPDDATIAALPPDGHGLTFLPLLTGERSLGWHGDARASLTGLHLSTTPAEMARAALEAVAYRVGAVAERVLNAAPHAQQIIGNSGALLSSPILPQIVADVLNRPITLTTEPEASSRGTVLLALEALGAQRIAAATFAWGQTFTPDAQRHAVYRRGMERQQALYRKVIG
jgi:gluconokinase